jgi:hypothetical protein
MKIEDCSSLPPPQPPDRPGIRPATNWQKVADMVRLIQKKLAGERVKAKGQIDERINFDNSQGFFRQDQVCVCIRKVRDGFVQGYAAGNG